MYTANDGLGLGITLARLLCGLVLLNLLAPAVNPWLVLVDYETRPWGTCIEEADAQRTIDWGKIGLPRASCV
jgi:hypothetical protein